VREMSLEQSLQRQLPSARHSVAQMFGLGFQPGDRSGVPPGFPDAFWNKPRSMHLQCIENFVQARAQAANILGGYRVNWRLAFLGNLTERFTLRVNQGSGAWARGEGIGFHAPTRP
jgi:hypothetical protein